MSADAQTLTKALQFALDLLRNDSNMTKLKATEEAAKQFDLGPLDEEWLLNHLTANKPAE